MQEAVPVASQVAPSAHRRTPEDPDAPGTMHWMVRAGRTRDDGAGPKWDVWTMGTAEFAWKLVPDNANITKVNLGDHVLAYSYDVNAFTHIGVVIGLPDDPKAPGATAETRLIRLADPIRRASLVRSESWKTEQGNPRAPFSRATTFSQPIDISDRWDTIGEALLPYDSRRFEILVGDTGFGPQRSPDPDWSEPRPISA